MDIKTPTQQAVGPEQTKLWTEALQKYKAGRGTTEQRIIASEDWWKLRNTEQEQGDTEIGVLGGFTSKSAWLHNVITSKHADGMEAYPQPVILPREVGDKAEAQILSEIIPCILEMNDFEATYSEVLWQKMKFGTGVYKVVWNPQKLNGLGDISVEPVNLLNLFWEPGITDIQQSKYIFQTELVDKDVLMELYPQLEPAQLEKGMVMGTFNYDDTVDTSDKVTVIEVYYHKNKKLHFARYVGETILYASEDDTQSYEGVPSPAEVGWYAHGLYPYVFDTLYPIEGSPCGYGYVDICKNPQTQIDLLNTAFLDNAMVGARPRYFTRQDASFNRQQFMDTKQSLVDVVGNLDDKSLRRIDYQPLDGVYMNVLNGLISELRETSGNTETSTGNAGSGVTAASAIAALQEASGKGSRDATKASYRAYREIINLCVELIRQFYDAPRKFRILGEHGAEQFVQYTNAGLQPQPQGNDFGVDMGMRLPVFDIEVSAQKKNVYASLSQNELALQFYSAGFFEPERAQQAIICLEMMDFDGRDELIQKIQQNQMSQTMMWQQMAVSLADKYEPDKANVLRQQLGMGPAAGPAPAEMPKEQSKESTRMQNVRQRAANAAQPGGGV